MQASWGDSCCSKLVYVRRKASVTSSNRKNEGTHLSPQAWTMCMTRKDLICSTVFTFWKIGVMSLSGGLLLQSWGVLTCSLGLVAWRSSLKHWVCGSLCLRCLLSFWANSNVSGLTFSLSSMGTVRLRDMLLVWLVTWDARLTSTESGITNRRWLPKLLDRFNKDFSITLVYQRVAETPNVTE